MIKQYVNLPLDADEHHGNRINLEVESSGLSSEDVARAEWWVEPVGADNQDQKYLSRTSRARVRYQNTRNRNDKFKNRLMLPHVGGDKYVVKCSKKGDRSSPVEIEEIQTWRKLYYTVHYMNTDCRTFFNDLKSKFEAAFAECFIEMENAASIATLVDEPHTLASNALTHLYNTRPRLTNRPYHLRLVILNNLYERETNEYTDVTSDPVYVQATDEGLAPGREIRSVHAKRVGRASWISVTQHATKTGDKAITVKLEDNTRIKRILDAGHDVDIRVRTREREEYLGHSIGNFCCARINETGTLAARKITVLQTLTHEVGHGCQQVIKRERLHNAHGSTSGWEANPIWHTDKFGGQGPHCSTNAKKVASTETTSNEIYAWDSGTLCTMFFSDESHVDADGKFCAECKPRLTRANISRANMGRKGWNRY